MYLNNLLFILYIIYPVLDLCTMIINIVNAAESDNKELIDTVFRSQSCYVTET